MHLAWLYLLHARFQRDGVDYRYRNPNGRFIKVDGEPRTWELSKCTAERWGETDAVRKNLELTIALRNKIEHRYEDATALVTSGYAHAMLVNYDMELTGSFGAKESIGDQLRFPVFVGTFTMDSARQWTSARNSLPKKTREFLSRFVADVGPTVSDDPRFDFRINLVPKLGPKSSSDMAMTFTREDELSSSQREALEQLGKSGKVLVREQHRPVANLGLMRPTAVAAAIEARTPFCFRPSSEVPTAWKRLKCRPKHGDAHPERTDERYCLYDQAHDDYLYTPAFVEKVVRETETEGKFEKFMGRSPRKKPGQAASVPVKG